MLPDEFRQQLCKPKRLTRELIVERGDPGCEPITKISGVPWWPAGLARPICGVGHLMSFMAQIRLSDVPGFESEDDILISFHYCQQCAYDGKMLWGWDCCSNRSGHAVSVISEIGSKKSDQLGAVAEVVIEPNRSGEWHLAFSREGGSPNVRGQLTSIDLVPEPSILMLFGSGLALISITIRGRRAGGADYAD
jgi:hypothetical protein